MKRLFTYTIPVDDGAAPNPFHGMCSLAICKPGIRRVAKPDDWVAGLGSKNAPSGDLSGHLVYAMRVEEVMSMQDYNIDASTRWPHRIPNVQSFALQDRLGDCIYDFSTGTPFQRVDFTRFRRHKSTSSLKLLERKRAHLVKMTVPADSIVKTFNVIKYV